METLSYIIGIDLGTTNCTLSYATNTERLEASSIELCNIPQISGQQFDDKKFILPSFIYYPLAEELKTKTKELPWQSEQSYVIGEYARQRGAQQPNRLISSAKSWLCHSGVDRRSKLLPLTAEDPSLQMSPMHSCGELLKHLQAAWDHAMPESPFIKQQVLITVPASFDPSARQLVQEAARYANYPEVILLEEPQAAFYAWLQTHETDWRTYLQVGDVVLVIDIGGGTTDFSLISVQEDKGSLQLQRLAVGDHLLLGGDNLDLALAYLCKQKLEEQNRVTIDSWQLQELIHQCRDAKERLLSTEPPDNVEITLLGRSSRLMANVLHTQLTYAEVYATLIEGFIPLVSPEIRSKTQKRMGMQQIGLPYAQDARIACQLAKFLSLSGETDTADMEKFMLPTKVLFNGGTFKAAALRERLLTLLNNWAQILHSPKVKELSGADYDYAVSRGAVYYGIARQGTGIRIRSGTSRSYFLGVEEAMPAVPSIQPTLRAVCIVPFGMEEGEERTLEKQKFALVVGESATFRFFSRGTALLSDGTSPEVGCVVHNYKQELTELSPIEALLDKQEIEGKTVWVHLTSKVTELGALELWCVADDGRRWKLEFEIRQ